MEDDWLFTNTCFDWIHRYPDEDVGELPMAFVVIDKEKNGLTKSEIMLFVSKSVSNRSS